MDYPDLSPYPNEQQAEDPLELCVGWLDRTHEYPQGNSPELFIERLWIFCRAPVHQMRGYHECELCSAPTSGVHVRRGDEENSLGSAQIRVFGSGDATYAAPNLIYHYVVDHHYRPPEAFIQAVLEGPLPDSPEYHARANQFEWGRRAARIRRLEERR